MRSFSILSVGVAKFIFCKVLTVGDLMFSKYDFITITRRPGLWGSDSLSFFHSSRFLHPTTKVFWLNCFYVLLFIPVFG